MTESRTGQQAAATSRAPWLHLRERGSGRLLHGFARMSRAIGRGPSRLVLRMITLYFLLFAPRARRASRGYLRRVLQREPGLADVYRHFFCFATTIHDRVFLARGALSQFDVEVIGAELLDEAAATGRGTILLGAHLGSFDMINAVGQLRAGLRVAMAMYEENARKVRGMLDALRPPLRPRIIALGRMEAMLQIRDELERGTLVGILADRTLGAEPTRTVEILGAAADLPTGPMRAAALLRQRVLFMAGLHLGGNRYRIVLAPITDFSEAEPAGRERQIGAAIETYASLLSQHCSAAPYNWFNFYDFWRE